MPIRGMCASFCTMTPRFATIGGARVHLCAMWGSNRYRRRVVVVASRNIPGGTPHRPCGLYRADPPRRTQARTCQGRPRTPKLLPETFQGRPSVCQVFPKVPSGFERCPWASRDAFRSSAHCPGGGSMDFQHRPKAFNGPPERCARTEPRASHSRVAIVHRSEQAPEESVFHAFRTGGRGHCLYQLHAADWAPRWQQPRREGL